MSEAWVFVEMPHTADERVLAWEHVSTLPELPYTREDGIVVTSTLCIPKLQWDSLPVVHERRMTKLIAAEKFIDALAEGKPAKLLRHLASKAGYSQECISHIG